MSTQNYRIEIFRNIVEARIAQGHGALGFPKGTERSSDIPRSRVDAAHTIAEIVQLPGWTNGKAAQGLQFERDGEIVRRVCVERHTISGAYTRSQGGFFGSFRVNGDGRAPVDGLMSLGLSLLCEDRGDLLLHASAVTMGDYALLFLGPGGSGKTTIATELRGDSETFCVDKTLVTVWPDGVLRAYSTPFGEGFPSDWCQRSAVVAGLFFIEQSECHEIAPMSPWETTTRLLKQTTACSPARSSVNGIMDTIGRIAELGVSFHLEFSRDEGFWPLIERVLKKGR
jgi:hypothetical protein